MLPDASAKMRNFIDTEGNRGRYREAGPRAGRGGGEGEKESPSERALGGCAVRMLGRGSFPPFMTSLRLLRLPSVKALCTLYCGIRT